MNFMLRRKGLGRTSCKEIVALSKTGIQSFRNDAKLPAGDIVFRWGCTSNVEARSTVNPAKAIHLVGDKREFRLILDREGLCPKTWIDPAQATYPCVVRPRVHHQGRHLYVCNNRRELDIAWGKVNRDGYIAAYIDKVAEYRVFVVSGRVPCVASKTPNAAGGPAWNVAQGGKFDNVRWDDWPLKAVKTAIKAFNLSGLDFGGVDVMVDRAGNCYVLEINSAPSLTSPYRQQCMAKAFDYIVKHGKQTIPMMEKAGGYTKFIHPAVCDNAILA